jgi:hypothetical protein
MTARKTPRKVKPAAAPLAAWSAPNDGGRKQLAVASESADAMVRGFEAMRKIHDGAVQSALARYTAAAQKLASPRQPMELVAIPGDLMRLEIEGVTSYWQALGAAAMEMQAELLGCSSHLVDSDALLQTASAVDALPTFPFYGFDRFFGAVRTA